MPDVQVVTTVADTLDNLLRLHDYASGSSEEKAFHRARLFNAEHQVYYQTEDGPIFAPVKWCGALSNSIHDYNTKKEPVTQVFQRALRNIGFTQIADGEADHSTIYSRFIETLDGFGFEHSSAGVPHSASRPRIFWAFPGAKLRQRRLFPDEAPDGTYPEGATKTIKVNAYERSAKARLACIAHYGWACQACGLNFEDRYGSVGAEFIHVHHLRPLATLKKQYQIDPIADLRPICPNCHAMVHRSEPVLSIEELRERLSSS